MTRTEKKLTSNGYPETWQSKGLKKSMSEISIEFRDWCLDKQIPSVRNGYQNLSTQQLWEEFNNDN